MDACNLISKADVEKAFGYTVKELKTSTVGVTTCRYENTEFGKGFFEFAINPSVADKASWEIYAKTIGFDKGKVVAGLGDSAYSEIQTATKAAIVHVWLSGKKAGVDFRYAGGADDTITDANVQKVVDTAKLFVGKAG